MAEHFLTRLVIMVSFHYIADRITDRYQVAHILGIALAMSEDLATRIEDGQQHEIFPGTMARPNGLLGWFSFLEPGAFGNWSKRPQVGQKILRCLPSDSRLRFALSARQQLGTGGPGGQLRYYAPHPDVFLPVVSCAEKYPHGNAVAFLVRR